MDGPDRDPYDVLQDLLDRGGACTAVVQASGTFLDFADAAELDETREAFDADFSRIVDDLSVDLGGPRFCGDHEHPSFPSWLRAERAAVWATDDDRAAYLTLTHASAEAPFRLQLGVR